MPWVREKSSIDATSKRKLRRVTSFVALIVVFLMVSSRTKIFSPTERSNASNTRTTSGKIPKRFKLCMHINQLNRRGIEVANYNYIVGLQRFYRVESFEIACLTPEFVLTEQAPQFPDVTEKFNKVCGGTIHGYAPGDDGWKKRAPDGFWHFGGPSMVATLQALKCDMLYSQKSGELRSPPQVDSNSLRIPWAVHAVFQTHQPHGTSFAAISEHMASRQCSRRGYERIFVDYIVDIPQEEAALNTTQMRHDKRKELGIPINALVLCRHGGEVTFNIDFVRDNLHVIVGVDYRVHVVLMNTLPVAHIHPRIHELEGESTNFGKAKFFAMCDAMLHARADGETFGLAVAEFSIRNKPVITYNGDNILGYAQAHVNLLGQRGLYYHDLSSLQSVVTQLINEGVPDRAWNAYENFSASNIIPKFVKVFIEPAQDWWVEVKSRGIDDVWDVPFDSLPSLNRACDARDNLRSKVGV